MQAFRLTFFSPWHELQVHAPYVGLRGAIHGFCVMVT